MYVPSLRKADLTPIQRRLKEAAHFKVKEKSALGWGCRPLADHMTNKPRPWLYHSTTEN